MNTEIPPGLSDGIDPGAISIPPVKIEDLEEAARAIKGDGQDVSDIGNDIKSAWHGLESFYAAPEDGTLFSKIDPVATKGDEIDDAAQTAGDALLAFAEDVRPILERWRNLKADAHGMQEHIDGNEDWREDEDKVEEFNQLNNDLIKVQNDFMAAERECANKITALFGGTTFVAAEPGSEPNVGEGEQAYGYTEAPEDVATPWAIPQEHDAPWYADVGSALVDLTWGSVKDTLGMFGFHDGQGDWTLDPGTMWDNAGQNLSDTFAGAKMLAGFGPDGFSWSTMGTAWKEVAHSMVPWREWGDRPGYVITQSVVNIGSIVGGALLTASVVGAPAGATLLAWRGTRIVRTLGNLGDMGSGSGSGAGNHGDEGSSSGSEGSDGSGYRPDLEFDGSDGLPTTQEIQDELGHWEDLAAEIGWEETMQRSAELAEIAQQRQPVMAGAPDIEANADGPNDPPSTDPKPSPPVHDPPAPPRPADPTPSPSGEGGPSGGGPPGGGGGGGNPPNGGGGRPPGPEGNGQGDAGDGDEDRSKPGESPTPEPPASQQPEGAENAPESGSVDPQPSPEGQSDQDAPESELSDTAPSSGQDGEHTDTPSDSLGGPNDLPQDTPEVPGQPDDAPNEWHQSSDGIEDLISAVESGIVDRKEFSDGGGGGVTELVHFADGTSAVHKITDDTPWDSADQFGGATARGRADADQLASQVGRAIGADVPGVYRVDSNEFYMHFMEGASGRNWQRDPQSPLTNSPSGRILGVLDVLIANSDRNAGNWLAADDGTVVGIDHGESWHQDGPPDAPRDPLDLDGFIFTDTMEPYYDFDRNQWIDNPLTREDVEWMKPRLTELRPEFVRLGREEWFDHMMARFSMLENHASGSTNMIARDE